MTVFRRLARCLVLPLAALMLATSMPIGVAQAGLVTTDALIEPEAAAADRERVMAFVEREDVREEIRAMGVDPDEAAARVASLSDAEIAEIAGRLDSAPAGEGIVGPIVGAIVLVFIVLLVTDLLCLTTVFNFTRCAPGTSQ